MAVAWALRGRRGVLDALGLAGSPWTALAFTLACSAIVPIGYALGADLAAGDALALDLMRTAVLPGIAEELLFRAFLFGFLYRYAGWGFLPAALLAALVFGVEHVYQGGDTGEALAIAALTGLGGLWWSWLLVEWRWNLWVPIGFHVLLNAYWTVFDMADDALGGGWTVALRGVCILLSIVGTLALARRRGGRQLTGARWWRGDDGTRRAPDAAPAH
jgi:membrane protease YdiL (CAAX protease family)